MTIKVRNSVELWLLKSEIQLNYDLKSEIQLSYDLKSEIQLNYDY